MNNYRKSYNEDNNSNRFPFQTNTGSNNNDQNNNYSNNINLDEMINLLKNKGFNVFPQGSRDDYRGDNSDGYRGGYSRGSYRGGSSKGSYRGGSGRGFYRGGNGRGGSYFNNREINSENSDFINENSYYINKNTDSNSRYRGNYNNNRNNFQRRGFYQNDRGSRSRHYNNYNNENYNKSNYNNNNNNYRNNNDDYNRRNIIPNNDYEKYDNEKNKNIINNDNNLLNPIALNKFQNILEDTNTNSNINPNIKSNLSNNNSNIPNNNFSNINTVSNISNQNSNIIVNLNDPTIKLTQKIEKFIKNCMKEKTNTYKMLSNFMNSNFEYLISLEDKTNINLQYVFRKFFIKQDNNNNNSLIIKRKKSVFDLMNHLYKQNELFKFKNLIDYYNSIKNSNNNLNNNDTVELLFEDKSICYSPCNTFVSAGFYFNSNEFEEFINKYLVIKSEFDKKNLTIDDHYEAYHNFGISNKNINDDKDINNDRVDKTIARRRLLLNIENFFNYYPIPCDNSYINCKYHTQQNDDKKVVDNDHTCLFSHNQNEIDFHPLNYKIKKCYNIDHYAQDLKNDDNEEYDDNNLDVTININSQNTNNNSNNNKDNYEENYYNNIYEENLSCPYYHSHLDFHFLFPLNTETRYIMKELESEFKDYLYSETEELMNYYTNDYVSIGNSSKKNESMLKNNEERNSHFFIEGFNIQTFKIFPCIEEEDKKCKLKNKDLIKKCLYYHSNNNDSNDDKKRPHSLFQYSNILCEEFLKNSNNGNNSCLLGRFCDKCHYKYEYYYHPINFGKIRHCNNEKLKNKDLLVGLEGGNNINNKSNEALNLLNNDSFMCKFYETCYSIHKSNNFFENSKYSNKDLKVVCSNPSCNSKIKEINFYKLGKCNHILCLSCFNSLSSNSDNKEEYKFYDCKKCKAKSMIYERKVDDKSDDNCEYNGCLHIKANFWESNHIDWSNIKIILVDENENKDNVDND